MRKKTTTKKKTTAKKGYKTPSGFKLVRKDGFGKSRNTRYVGRYKRLRNAYIYIIKDR